MPAVDLRPTAFREPAGSGRVCAIDVDQLVGLHAAGNSRHGLAYPSSSRQPEWLGWPLSAMSLQITEGTFAGRPFLAMTA
jgi:hypothetical protein